MIQYERTFPRVLAAITLLDLCTDCMHCLEAGEKKALIPVTAAPLCLY